MALTINSTAGLILVDVSLGPKTILLPPVSDRPGRVVTIKDSGSASLINTITIQTSGTDTFENSSTTHVLEIPYSFMTFISDGSSSQWKLMGSSDNSLFLAVSSISTNHIAANASSTINAYIEKATVGGTLDVTGFTTLNNVSTTGQAAFFSSVQIQGGLSVFSTIGAPSLSISGKAAMNTISSFYNETETTSTVNAYIENAYIKNLSVSYFTVQVVSSLVTEYISGVTINVANISSLNVSSIVSGEALFNSSMLIQGGLSVFSTIGAEAISIDSKAVVGGTLDVTGMTTLANSSNTGFFQVAGPVTMSSNISTLGQAAFYSSVQIQGGLSVFSSIATNDIHFTGGLYSNGVLFTGGSGSPIFSTMSTVGQAAFHSSVQIQGGLSVFSTLTAYNINFNGQLTSNGLPFATGISATSGFAQVAIPLSGSRGLCFDPSGNMYVSDASYNVIYKITPQGVTSLFAGTYGTNAVVDGYGSAASFTSIREMTYDSYSGWIMIATSLCLRAANPATGQVITLCGSSLGNANGTGTSASFNIITGISSDGSGNLYVCDGGNHNVSKISFTLPITANSATKTIIAGSTANPGTAGYYNATGTAATFNSPRSLVINSSKTLLWVTDLTNNVVRQVSLTSPYAVTTFAGAVGSSATPGNTTSPAAASTDSTISESVRFNGPYGVAIDASNNLYVTEYFGHYLRFINTSSFYTHTLAGSGTNTNTSGVGTNGTMSGPTAVTIDSYGNPWIATNVIAAIFNYSLQTGYLNLFYTPTNTLPTPANIQNTATSTIVVPGMATGILYGAGFTAFNSVVTYVSPQGLLMDSQNNLYVSDKFKIRKVAPSGFVTSVFGDPANSQSSNQPFPGAKGEYNGSYQMCMDDNTMYIADPGVSTIHVVNTVTGAVTNLTITGVTLMNCDGVLIKDGILYISNTNLVASPPAGYIVAVDLSTNVGTVVAGSTTVGALTNDTGAAARFKDIYGICFDLSKNNIFICDRGNTAIRQYNISSGAVTTYSTGVPIPTYIAADSLGNYYATSGTALYKITGGTATSFSSSFSYIVGITIDAFNNIYVSDVLNNCIYHVNPTGTASVYSGSPGIPGTQDSLYASTVSLLAPYVGIGKSNAQFTLDVAGSINYTGTLYNNGFPFTPGGTGTGTGTASLDTSDFAKVAIPLSGSRGLCFDPSGNMYVSDANNVIYKISPQGITSLFAGTYGGAVADGYGSAAGFSQIWNMVYDSYSGWIMIATQNTIRAANPATGQVITLCGSTVGNTNGTGTSANFDLVAGICSDGAGNLYVADANNHNISKVSFNLPMAANGGTKTLIAGSTANPGTAGYYNATGTAATFNSPRSLIINSSKSLLWVTDFTNNVVRQVSLTAPYAVTTFAGAVGSSATPGNTTSPSIESIDSTTPASVRFSGPFGVAIDASNNLYVTEYFGRRLRFMNTSSFYTQTLAGNGTISNTSGVGTNGTMAGPTAVALDTNGNPWIVNSPFVTPAIFNYNMQTGYLNLYYTPTESLIKADYIQNTPVSTLVTAGLATGTIFPSGFTAFNSAVTYLSPQGLFMDSQNNLFVSDKFKIRKVAPSGFVTSVFGDPANSQSSDQPFPGAKGQFNGSYQMCMDNSGNMYIADAGLSTIHVINMVTGAVRNITPTGVTLSSCYGVLFNDGILYISNTTTAISNVPVNPLAGYLVALNVATSVGTVIAGSTTVGALTNDTGAAARFKDIYGMCFDVSKNNIFICDRGNTAIRQYNISSGAVTTYSTGVLIPSYIAADSLGNYYATSGSVLYKITGGTAASFSSGFGDVFGITVDAFNNIYVSDVTNQCIYFINPAGSASVYSGNPGIAGTQDSLYASSITIQAPYVGIGKSNAQYTLDVAGSINYTGSLYNNGLLFPSAISATSGFAQVGLPITSSRGICFDPSGNMYVADSDKYVIYKISPQGATSVFAGSYGANLFVDGYGTAAGFSQIWNMTYDTYSGWIIIGTQTCIRAANPATAQVITLCGSSVAGNANGTGTTARFNVVSDTCSDGSGNLYVTDYINDNVSKVSFTLPITVNGGTKTVIAGSTASPGTAGYYNATGATATFASPASIVINSARNLLWVADSGNHVIRQITLPAGVVTTFAGPVGSSATPGNTAATFGHVDGSLTAATFIMPWGLAIDSNNNLFVTENSTSGTVSCYLRFINTSNNYTVTLAGGANTNASGVGANGTMAGPTAITLDAYGTPWIVTNGTAAIFNYNNQTGYLNLFYTPTSTLAKPVNFQNTATSTISVAAIATGAVFGSDFTSLNSIVSYVAPQGLFMDPQNNLYVSDKFKMRKVAPSGFVTSVFGDPSNTQNTNQLLPGSQGQYNGSYQMCMDPSGNLYIADPGTSTVHVINPSGGVKDITPSGVTFRSCYGVLFNAGILYVSNTNLLASPPAGYLVAVNIATNVGTVIAGSTTLGALTDASGTAARFNIIYGICFDVSKDNIFICDSGNAIRRYNISTAAVTTYSSVTSPSFIAGDSLGNFYVTAGANLYKVTGGTATSFGSGYSYATGVTVDSFNNVYISDVLNNCIYYINQSGITSVYSGSGLSGTQDSIYASTISFLAPYVGIGKSNAQFTLDVAGSLNFTGGLYSNGNAYIPGSDLVTLNVAGQTRLNNIDFTGVLTSNGTTFSGAPAGINSAGNVGIGAAAGATTLLVTGSQSNTGNLDVSGNTTVRGSLGVTGLTTLVNSSNTGTLGVAGLTTLTNSSNTGTLGVAGLTTLTNSSNTGTLGVAGLATLTNSSNTGTLGVAGLTTLTNSSNTGNLDVSGNTTVRGSLGVTGLTTLVNSSNTGTLGVAGNTTLTGSVGLNTSPITSFGTVVGSSAGFLSTVTMFQNTTVVGNLGSNTTFVGSGAAAQVPGVGTNASLDQPFALAFGPDGNMYVTAASISNNKPVVFKITPTGVATIFAGGSKGSANGQGTAASFNTIRGIAVALDGSIYVTDYGNGLIRKITPGGLVTTFYTDLVNTDPHGICIDSYGNVYVSYTGSRIIKKITPAGVATVLAGSGLDALTDGTGTAASFQVLYGLAIDLNNNIYAADKHTVRRITPSGVVTTVAGAATSGFVDDVGSLARFFNVYGVACDLQGNLYVADLSNQAIREITGGVVTTVARVGGSPCDLKLDNLGNLFFADWPANKINKISNTAIMTTNNISATIPGSVVTILAGSGTAGVTGGTGTSAFFNQPYGVYYAPDGIIYVADYSNHMIKKMTQAGVVTIFAGSGTVGSSNGTPGQPLTATFNYPEDMVMDAAGNLYVIDCGNHLIRRITSSGIVTTYAGIAGTTGSATGNITGAPGNATFNVPTAITIDMVGNLYVADFGSNLIRKIDVSGNVTNFVGNAVRQFIDGTGTGASLGTDASVGQIKYNPYDGNLYLANASSIRKITMAGVVTTVVGSMAALLDGPVSTALFKSARGLAFDPLGNIYVSEEFSIRKISNGVVTTIAGSVGNFNSTFNTCYRIDNDPYGNMYIAEYGNNRIRKIAYTAYNSSLVTIPNLAASTITTQSLTVTGSTTLSANTGFAQVTNLPFSGDSRGICFDPSGNMYIANNGFNVIHKITPQGQTSLFAGTPGVSGWVDGTGSAALFSSQGGQICYDPYTNCIALADTTALRLITLTGTVITMAGNASTGNATTPVSGALFNRLTGVCSDGSGSLYIVDATAGNIKKIILSSRTPTQYGCIVENVAGPTTGTGTAYVNGTGASARFNVPFHIAINPAKTFLYVPEFYTHVVRSISLPGYVVGTLAGALTSPIVAATDSTTATSVQFSNPIGIATDANGNVLVADYNNNSIRYINVSPFYTLTLAGKTANTGIASGVGANAQIYHPVGINVDSYGIPWIITDAGSIFNYNLQTGYANLFYRPTTTVPRPGNIQNTAVSTISMPGIATGTVYGSGYTITNPGVATYMNPEGIVIDSQNNVYVADQYKIRKITPSGLVTTIYGDPANTQAGNFPGRGSLSQTSTSYLLCLDTSGNMYFANAAAHVIYKLNLTTGVATQLPLPAVSPAAAQLGQCLWEPYGILYNNNKLYVANRGNIANGSYIVSIDLSTNAITLMAGSPSLGGGFQDGAGASAKFNGLTGMCFDITKANIYACDYGNSRVRIVNLTSPYNVSTLISGLTIPYGIAMDSLYNLYVTQQAVTTGVLKIPYNSSTQYGTLPLAAGAATNFMTTSTGAHGVAIDSYNNVYVTDIVSKLIYYASPGGTATVYSGSTGATGTQDSTYASSITLMAPYVGINTANPTAALHISGSSPGGIFTTLFTVEQGGVTAGFGAQMSLYTPNGGSWAITSLENGVSQYRMWFSLSNSGVGSATIYNAPLNTHPSPARSLSHIFRYNNSVELMNIANNGNMTAYGNIVSLGSITGASKNFKIPHPVLSNTTLTHASIEGPRYDLIYRNRKQLVNGMAEVDIEKESTSNGTTMSAGTFDALATNADVFLQNNDTFDRVKGYVSSHMLFIECENSNSSAFINWMVVAERHDPHVIDSEVTDASGFLVLERSPISEAPASETPESEPPISEAPASETPESEPPISEAPASETPESEPPASEPSPDSPESEPPASEHSPASEPPASEPPAPEEHSPASEPSASEPSASEPSS